MWRAVAGTVFPIGTGTGIGRNWVEKGSKIGNSLEFRGIPLRIHNQASYFVEIIEHVPGCQQLLQLGYSFGGCG